MGMQPHALLFAALPLLLLPLAACGDDHSPHADLPPEPYPSTTVDFDAWKADMVAAGSRRNPDMQELYRLALDDCAKKTTVDQLSLMFTLKGAADTAEFTRLGFKYVCPSQMKKFNRAKADAESYGVVFP